MNDPDFETPDRTEIDEHLLTLTRLLPQILEKMNGDIKAGAEAARTARKAAREAGEAGAAAGNMAAEAFTKAEAATSQSLSLLRRIEALEKRLEKLESSARRKDTAALSGMSRDDAKTRIATMFSAGDRLYYSDIARELGIDLGLVSDICDELVREGKIKIDRGS